MLKIAILPAITAILFASIIGILPVYGQGTVLQTTVTNTPRFMVQLMDLDKDGKISQEENMKFFIDADQDKDGFVTASEIMEFMRKKVAEANGPNLGDDAPDFALKTLDGESTVKLSSFKESDIIVLVFGNYTCPTFRSQAEILEQIYQQYKNKSKWFFVYIREAHPADGWQVDENIKDNIIINQPKTMEERVSVAKECHKNLGFTFNAVIDDIDNGGERAYAAWPDRLYIVDKKGKIAYKSEKGPDGFKPQDMAQTLARLCST